MFHNNNNRFLPPHRIKGLCLLTLKLTLVIMLSCKPDTSSPTAVTSDQTEDSITAVLDSAQTDTVLAITEVQSDCGGFAAAAKRHSAVTDIQETRDPYAYCSTERLYWTYLPEDSTLEVLFERVYSNCAGSYRATAQAHDDTVYLYINDERFGEPGDTSTVVEDACMCVFDFQTLIKGVPPSTDLTLQITRRSGISSYDTTGITFNTNDLSGMQEIESANLVIIYKGDTLLMNCGNGMDFPALRPDSSSRPDAAEWPRQEFLRTGRTRN